MDVNDAVYSLSKLQYFERRVTIKKIIRPAPARFLYKYRTVDPADDKSMDRLRDILIKSRLWLSSSDTFNDPFDMSAKFEISKNAQANRKKFVEIAKNNNLQHRDREQFARKMMLMPPHDLEKFLHNIYEQNINRVGVYSFAGDPRNILMWSHYASNHKGICIQFEVARDFPVFSHAIPVQYSKEYPRVEWATDFEKSLANVMLRKHKGWKYELEERIVLPEQANKYLEFNPEAVTSIILGCKVSSDITDAIFKILDERSSAQLADVKIYQATQHKNQYKLNICSHK